MKDAKGHGSNTKGGPKYARQAPTKNGRARMYGMSMADRIKIAQDQQNIKEGRSAGTPGNPLGRSAADMLDAADVLDSGTSKSAPTPVHDSMATITAPSATDAPGYYSRVSAKGGRVLGSYGPQASHEEAAKEAFAKHPNAKTVSTSRGKFGMDIRFHDRGNTKF